MTRRSRARGPLAYLGVAASDPPTVIIKDFDPTTKNDEYILGSIWINKLTNSVFILTNLDDAIANWSSFGTGSETTLVGNVGSAITLTNSANILGGGVLLTTGVAQTLTVSMTDGTNGQVLIGGTGSPAWGNVTSLDASVTITEGAGTLDLSVGGAGGGAQTFTTDAGNASTAGTTITIAGGLNINTAGAGSTVTVNLDASPSVTGSLTAVNDITTSTGDVVATLGSGTFGAAVSAVTDITTSTGDVVSTAGSGTFGAAVSAVTDITTSTGDVVSTAGSGTFGNAVSAVNNITTSTGDVVATAGSGTFGAAVSAVTNITTSTGDVVATLGAGNFNTTVTSGGAITSGGGVTALTGNIVTSVGNINSNGSITAGTSITATAGDIVASAQNIESTNGTVTAGAGLISTAGGLTTTGTNTLNDLGLGVVRSTAAGVLSSVNGTDGQLLIGNTGTAPGWGSLASAGGTIAITPGAGTLNLEVSGSAFVWTDVTGTTQALAINSGYVMNNAAIVTGTLPATASFGDVIEVAGYGAGGWRIAQNAGQEIIFGTGTTTSGVTGYLASTDKADVVRLLCVATNIKFTVIHSIGNITVA